MDIDLPFLNSYSELPLEFYAESNPDQVPSPNLIVWNTCLAEGLGLNLDLKSEKIKQNLSDVFSGNLVHLNSKPIATAYSGHQFGHFSPVLGDGRALLLGELKDAHGISHDVQLKGCGRTAYSRSGDGKSPLGPVIREYIVSEAMHRLGVPTTRSLAAVTTGEIVRREQPFEGGILTRVATCHIRVGTFEFFASRGDVKNLKVLLNYLTKRMYPELSHSADLPLDFFESLMRKQISLVAKWMSLGFIHGVMNTDNTSAVGITIDYGPCAFLDETDFAKVFSSIDRNKRYAYAKQPQILLWNLTRLAEALLFLYPKEQSAPAISKFEKLLKNYSELYEVEWKKVMLEKLGLNNPEDQNQIELLNLWLKYMSDQKIDFTLGFRDLSKIILGLETSTYTDDQAFETFKGAWTEEVLKTHSTAESAAIYLNLKNPLFIPRNHMVEKAIQDAYRSDFSTFNEMIEVLKNPFTETENYSTYSKPPKDSEVVRETFCGT